MVHTDARGQRWLRVGECNRCGACCGGGDPSVKNPMFTQADLASRTIEGRCPLLRFDGERFACAGHGTSEFYLNGCATFPARPEDSAMYESCSFSWVAVP